MADRNDNRETAVADFKQTLAKIMELHSLETFPQVLEILDLPPLALGRWLEE